MKYIDEFRDKKLVQKLTDGIKKLSSSCGQVNLMEVCGTHTMAIFRSGIKQLLPKNINLVSGPGCPVCVTSQADIDRMLELAGVRNAIITTFGDMLKVPGTRSSLEKIRSNGADIRPIYSPLDTLELSRDNPDREVIFLAVGFETTSPAIASVVHDAKTQGLKNFSVYCCHKLIPPAMACLMESREIKISGFLCPGHVTTVIGTRAYEIISQRFRIPCVISGFEPTDILETILMLLQQIKTSKALVQIQYKRAVKPEGNVLAQRMLKEVFSPGDADWRGLGSIPASGLKLNPAYIAFDAGIKFRIKPVKAVEPRNCSCGEILRGVKTPDQCQLFAKACTPENPFGPCMVSTEGTCAAWYKYNR